ncbi:hypothetical protein BGZ80_008349 [Entomortierella chlamydospora]|uniref:Uncharacterized protein n=1 Tax=Entomortierella chlamydospora TaxID=101097 RepID=A0A9P6N4N2_9FUNG|nr:hypothetical protein BGZ79_009909 [Entomortierella chlamydospora]KAG0023724.1 hypothetical protein BGZ80_008349 [Entomortierella chlamydospora]
MSPITNAFRSASSPARHFTSFNVSHISTASTVKTAFHPEHHPIVLQQLVESISPKATGAMPSVVGESLSARAANSASQQTKA